MEAREYQLRSIESVRQSLRRSDSVILQLPTGAGKTYIASEIIKKARARNKTCMFVCDKVNLIDQTSDAFDTLGIEHGVIQREHWKTDYSKPVQVASVQTLMRRKPHHADIVIIDEAHTQYNYVNDILSKWNSKFIGLTATPYAKGMGRHWDDLVIGATTQELIDAGWLSDYEVYAPPPPDLRGVKVVRGDYHTKQLVDRVNRREIVGEVVKNWFKHGNGGKTVVFAVNIEHSMHIAQAFNDAGIRAAHIDFRTEGLDRHNMLRDYRTGDLRVVSCVDILTKGFDAPSTSVVVQARPTKSIIVHLQQIGRGLRIAEGKEMCTILDHGGNVERHGFPSDETLPRALDRTLPSIPQIKEFKAEKTPKACGKCNFMKPIGAHECPQCGFKPVRQNIVHETDDDLIRVKQSKLKANKQQFYSELLGYAQKKGHQVGWAAHQFKDKFKEWPNGLRKIAVEPTSQIGNWVKHQAIRRKHTRR